MKGHLWREVTPACGDFIPQDLSHGAVPLPGGVCNPTGQPGSCIPLELSPSASSLGNQILLSTFKWINPHSPSPLGTWPLPSARHTVKHQPFIDVSHFTSVQHNPTKLRRAKTSPALCPATTAQPLPQPPCKH